jgi:hypothetical protein
LLEIDIVLQILLDARGAREERRCVKGGFALGYPKKLLVHSLAERFASA